MTTEPGRVVAHDALVAARHRRGFGYHLIEKRGRDIKRQQSPHEARQFLRRHEAGEIWRGQQHQHRQHDLGIDGIETPGEVGQHDAGGQEDQQEKGTARPCQPGPDHERQEKECRDEACEGQNPLLLKPQRRGHRRGQRREAAHQRQ